MGLTRLGKLVKIELIQRNMTQKELADKIGTTIQNLNGVLHGQASKKVEAELYKFLGLKTYPKEDKNDKDIN